MSKPGIYLYELRIDREGSGRREVRQHGIGSGDGVVLARDHHAVAPLSQPVSDLLS